MLAGRFGREGQVYGPGMDMKPAWDQLDPIRQIQKANEVADVLKKLPVELDRFHKAEDERREAGGEEPLDPSRS